MVGAPRGGFLVAFARGVVDIESFTTEAVGQPIGSGNDPLQEGLGPMVRGRRTCQRVRGLCVVACSRVRVRVSGVGERRKVTLQQPRRVAFDVIESECRVGCVHMRGLALLVTLRCGVLWTVLRLVSLQDVGRNLQTGAFCELAQVMQVGGKGDAAGGVHELRRGAHRMSRENLVVRLLLDAPVGERWIVISYL